MFFGPLLCYELLVGICQRKGFVFKKVWKILKTLFLKIREWFNLIKSWLSPIVKKLVSLCLNPVFPTVILY